MIIIERLSFSNLYTVTLTDESNLIAPFWMGYLLLLIAGIFGSGMSKVWRFHEEYFCGTLHTLILASKKFYTFKFNR